MLRDDDDDVGVIAYILNNPIRAGLVTCCADYPFWGSLTHTRDQILEFMAGVPEWQRP